MASTTLYLDTRRKRKDGTSGLFVTINARNKTAFLPIPVRLLPGEWDAVSGRVVGRSDRKVLNTIIEQYRADVDRILLRLSADRASARLTAPELKEIVLDELDPERKAAKADKRMFEHNFLDFTRRHEGRTRELYEATYARLKEFLRDKLCTLRFEDIDKGWLTRFDQFLSAKSPAKNARNIHLRNIRAVFNDAIDREVTNVYPFRRFTIKPEETAKRSLTVEELRRFLNMDIEPYQRQYRDVFFLMFYLCGINIVDLLRLKELVGGRAEYRRAKTHKLYSIKVEPEAMEIIERYRGSERLLNILDRFKDYRNYSMRLNARLKDFGFPGLTTYWARHTWATIACELDIPDDVISRALGHTITSGARVTEVYINFNRKKIDEANRRVIDYVLYDKR
ncbi:MAG: site-specific integrase [Prevotella sp.]|nr:site-specific integrase [Prevotella sp.]